MFNFSKKIKKIIAAVSICTAVIVVIIIANVIDSSKSVDCGVAKSEDCNIMLQVDSNTLNEQNIEIGDCVDISFSTGYKVEDVAILNGKFLNTGSHIIVIENENTKPVFQIQDETDTWTKASLNENSTCHFSLNTKAKYKNLNSAFMFDFDNTKQNSRSLRGGSLKLLDIFRGSLEKNTSNIPVVSYEFTKQLQITNLINLSQNSYGTTTFNIKFKECNNLIVDTLKSITNNNSRAFIYSSNEDLTAYFCAILEAIAGASYYEIVADYMETYKNFYGITQEANPDEYEAIKTYHIDTFLHQFTKTPPDYDLHKCNFAYNAEMYLRARQLHDDDIERIKNRLCQ